jgi:hypothetical protein
MKFIAFILLFLLSFSIMAEDEFLSLGRDSFKKDESAWNLIVSVDVMYRFFTPLPAFDSENYDQFDISGKEVDNVFSMPMLTINTGRDFALGNFVFSLNGSFGYGKVTNEIVGQVASDVDLDVAELNTYFEGIKTEFSGSLGYRFHKWDLAVIPFLEYGVGTFNLNTRIYFEFLDTGLSIDEFYNLTRSQSFITSRLGTGVKFISSRGVASWIKVSYASYFLQETKGVLKFKTQSGAASVGDATEGTNDGQDQLDIFDISFGFGVMF